MIIAASVFASSLRIGNDTWSMGLSENDDDLLTWSIGYTQDIGRGISVFADMFSFTDRGSGKGDLFHKGRYDTTEIGALWNFDLPDPARLPVLLSARVSGGLSLKGKFAGQASQNIIHRFLGIPEVYLPYPEKMQAFPEAAVTVESLWFPQKAVSVKASISGGYAMTSLFAGTSLSGQVSFHGVDGFVCADYVWRKQGDERIDRLWTENVSGFGLGFGYNLGLMSFSFRFSPSTGRGYGVIAVDSEKISDRSWERTEIDFRLYKTMMTGFIGFYGTDIAWNANEWFSASFRCLYSGGYPGKGRAITDFYRMRRNYGIWMVGGEFGHDFGFVRLSVNVHAGISRWCVDRMTNTDPSPDTVNERTVDCVCPCASVSAGISVLPEGFVVAGPTSIRLYVTGGCMLLTRQAGDALKKDLMHDEWTWHVADPFLGLGLEFGF